MAIVHQVKLVELLIIVNVVYMRHVAKYHLAKQILVQIMSVNVVQLMPATLLTL